MCLCFLRQLRFVISLHQLPGCGFEGLEVKGRPEVAQTSEPTPGPPGAGRKLVAGLAGPFCMEPRASPCSGVTQASGCPCPGSAPPGPFQHHPWWPGVGTPPELKLQAPTLQNLLDGPSGAWVAEPAVFPICPLSSPHSLLGCLSSEQSWAPGCPANPFTGLAPSSGVTSEGGWQAGGLLWGGSQLGSFSFLESISSHPIRCLSP